MRIFTITFILFTISIACCNPKIPQQTQEAVNDEKKLTGIDTIVMFDPETIEEVIIIINHDTGQRDTMYRTDLD